MSTPKLRVEDAPVETEAPSPFVPRELHERLVGYQRDLTKAQGDRDAYAKQCAVADERWRERWGQREAEWQGAGRNREFARFSFWVGLYALLATAVAMVALPPYLAFHRWVDVAWCWLALPGLALLTIFLYIVDHQQHAPGPG